MDLLYATFRRDRFDVRRFGVTDSSLGRLDVGTFRCLYDSAWKGAICERTQLSRFALECAKRRNHHVLEVLKVNNKRLYINGFIKVSQDIILKRIKLFYNF